MPTPAIQTLLTDAQQVLNLNSLSEVRATMAAALANANVGTPLNPNLTTQQLWDEFYLIVRQPESDIESIITNQLMKFLFAPPAPGGVGADGQVIFNDGGVLAGDPQFLWNKTTNLLTVTGSATITGNLTVDTNTLFVDSVNNRVGIGTASPTALFHILAPGSDSAGVRLQASGGRTFDISSTAAGYGSANNLIIYDITGSAERWRLDATGIHTWSNVGGVAGTAMTLNSTGLGVGAVSGAGLGKLYSYQDQDNPAGRFTNVNASQTNTTLQILSARNTTNDTFRALSYYNTGAAAFKFYVIDSGAIYSTSTSITGISDISLKENVKDLETGLSQILALKPRRFDWKDGSASNVQGFVAQEVEGILPDLVTNYRYNDTESKKALRLGDMIPTLVKAIQELAAEVNALKNA
jgi:hypothetical protein